MENKWWKEAEPFYLEVELDKLIDETQLDILSSMIKGTDLLPGLKVNKVFTKLEIDEETEGNEDVLLNKLIADFDDIIKKVSDVKNKWKPTNKKSSTINVEENKSTANKKKSKPVVENDFLKNNMESDWIEMNGKQNTFPDMQF